MVFMLLSSILYLWYTFQHINILLFKFLMGKLKFAQFLYYFREFLHTPGNPRHFVFPGIVHPYLLLWVIHSSVIQLKFNNLIIYYVYMRTV